jgi:hypothetical protein
MTRSRDGRLAVRRLFGITFLAFTLLLSPCGAQDASAADVTIYSEGLASGWQNWSWSSFVNFTASGAAWGTKAIGWQILGGWGGLYLHTDSAVQTGSGTALQFALMGSREPQYLQVSVYGDNSHPIGWARSLSDFGGAPTAYQWKWYSIPLSALGAAGQRVSGVVIQDANGWAQPTIQLDEIKLTAVATGGGGTSSASGNCLGVPAYPEVRWENAAQNATPGRPTNPAAFHGWQGWRWYYDRIDGACTGTTEQILEWAAKKWGFDQLGYPDLAKAMAVQETWWRESFVGNHGEVGILQIHPTWWPDYQPASWSTGYAADYVMAVIRSYYDGAQWFGAATKGDLRGSVAAWYCGCPYAGWDWYASTAFHYNDTKPWKRAGQPPEWF